MVVLLLFLWLSLWLLCLVRTSLSKKHNYLCIISISNIDVFCYEWNLELFEFTIHIGYFILFEHNSHVGPLHNPTY
jgi:hypothetical protein